MHRFFSGLACGLALAHSVYAVVLDQEVSQGLPDTGLDTSNWTAGELPDIGDMITLNDFQIAAKNYMSAKYYTQYRTGALDETSRNRPSKMSVELLLTHVKLYSLHQ